MIIHYGFIHRACVFLLEQVINVYISQRDRVSAMFYSKAR